MTTYYLYTLTNIVNGKIYVGLSNEPYRRLEEHYLRSENKTADYKINRAIRKYGFSSFKFCVLGSGSFDFIAAMEVKLISNLDTKGSGYNDSNGGEGTRHHKPWNKDSKGLCKPNKTSFKRGEINGENHPNSKFSGQQRQEIFDAYNDGYDLKTLSNHYKVCFSTLYRIVNYIGKLKNENKKYKRQPKGIRKKELPFN
jgi:group I intron endonuclease